MKKELITHIAQRLHGWGYTVYIAESGEYGFYTDGVRVVCFGSHWRGSVDFSGNYRTNAPQSTGTGWKFSDGDMLTDITEEKARGFITAHAPDWAVRGASVVNYTTPAQHLKVYQPSSRYKRFPVRQFANTAAALVVYDAGRAARRAAWDAIETDDDATAAKEADRAALAMVQAAFHSDTSDINSKEHCALVDIDFMRRMAAEEVAK